MKRLLSFSLSMVVLASCAAQDINVKRISVRDSFWIGGKWVKALDTSKNMAGAAHNVLGSSKQIKDYIDEKVINAGGGVDNNNYTSSVERNGLDVRLRGDQPNPGPLKMYSTDANGVLGYYPIPTVGGSSTTLPTQRLGGRYSAGTGGVEPVLIGAGLVLDGSGLLKAAPVYTGRFNGITGAGNHTTALQARFNAAPLVELDEPQDYSITGTLNGNGKVLSLKNGARLTGAVTLGAIGLEASPTAEIIDTSINLTSVTNTVIYARWFGFSTSSSPAKNLRAWQRITNLANAMSGGITVVLEKGEYVAGKEVFSGSGSAGYSYMGTRLVDLHNCAKPVVIEGNGAVIKLPGGMHYGSFNPVSGAPYYPPQGGFADLNYYAPIRSIFWFQNNASVTVRNLVLDGNISQAVIGGYFGDQGYQLEADAITAIDNSELVLDGVQGLHTGRDGLLLMNAVTHATPLKMATLLNCTFDGNGRQALSHVGGNHLYALNCQFLNTGRTVNTGTGSPFGSSPGAGIDLEPEVGLVKNALFENCLIDNNVGAGVVNDAATSALDITFRNCKIVGTTANSVYGLSRRMLWENCTIVGAMTSLVTAGSTGLHDPNNARFNNCVITMDTTFSPNGKVYGCYVLDMGGGSSAYFKGCTINSANRGSVYAGFGVVWDGCTFIRSNVNVTGLGCDGMSSNDFLTGYFKGTNRRISTAAPGNQPFLGQSTFEGPFYHVQGSTVTDIAKLSPDSLRKAIIDVRRIAQGYEAVHNDGRRDTLPVDATYVPQAGNGLQVVNGVTELGGNLTKTTTINLNGAPKELTIRTVSSTNRIALRGAASTDSSQLFVRGGVSTGSQAYLEHYGNGSSLVQVLRDEQGKAAARLRASSSAGIGADIRVGNDSVVLFQRDGRYRFANVAAETNANDLVTISPTGDIARAPRTDSTIRFSQYAGNHYTVLDKTFPATAASAGLLEVTITAVSENNWGVAKWHLGYGINTSGSLEVVTRLHGDDALKKDVLPTIEAVVTGTRLQVKVYDANTVDAQVFYKVCIAWQKEEL